MENWIVKKCVSFSSIISIRWFDNCWNQNTVISGSPTIGLSAPLEIIADAPVPRFHSCS